MRVEGAGCEEELAHTVSLLGEVLVSSYTAFLADGCPGTGHHRSNGYIRGEREEEADTNEESGEMKKSIWVTGNACTHTTQCTYIIYIPNTNLLPLHIKPDIKYVLEALSCTTSL